MAERFRSDIDGLRAVAVTLVVLFHAGLPGFNGGFVGVDVFFVISGFLITRKLIAELEDRGSIDLVPFWLGRAKRLLPAAATMIIATVCVQFAVRNPLHWRAAIDEAWAATFYFSNEFVARSPDGYFDETRVERALLHTWSLSVEEQFYIVWPLLLSVLVGARVRRAGVIVAVLAVVSLAWSALLTINGSPFAYLSAASRAWEFLLGAALGLPPVAAALRRSPVTQRIAQPLALVGLASILGSSMVLSESGGFPFPTAVVPVLGTAAIIAARVDSNSTLGTVLGARAFQAVGRLSYSWYLWHWPVLVLGQEMLGSSRVGTRLALAVFSLVPAALSFYLIENPVRRFTPRTIPGLAVVGLALPSLLVVGVLLTGSHRDSNEFAPPEALALRDAQTDWPAQFGVTCSLPDVEWLERDCVGGDAESETTVLLLGDSHASQWFSTLDELGSRQGIRIVALHQGNCPAVVLRDDPDLRGVCRQVVDELETVIDYFDPTTVVVSHADVYGLEDPHAWEVGLSRLADDLATEGRSTLVIHDVPRFEQDPTLCLAANNPASSDADARCSTDRAWVETRREVVERAEFTVASRHPHVVAWDPLDLLCGATDCPPRIAGEVVYLDRHHITSSFARSLADDLAPALDEALGLAARPS